MKLKWIIMKTHYNIKEIKLYNIDINNLESKINTNWQVVNSCVYIASEMNAI